jgi:hypothetical protein
MQSDVSRLPENAELIVVWHSSSYGQNTERTCINSLPVRSWLRNDLQNRLSKTTSDFNSWQTFTAKGCGKNDDSLTRSRFCACHLGDHWPGQPGRCRRSWHAEGQHLSARATSLRFAFAPSSVHMRVSRIFASRRQRPSCERASDRKFLIRKIPRKGYLYG